MWSNNELYHETYLIIIKFLKKVAYSTLYAAWFAFRGNNV